MSYRVLAMVLLAPWLIPCLAAGQEQRVVDQIQRQMAYIERAYGWTIELNPKPVRGISGRVIGIENHQRLLAFLTVLSRELRQHDANLLRNAGPVRMNIVQDMRGQTGVVAKFAFYSTTYDEIYLSVDRIRLEEHAITVIHHELYHLLHRRFLGSTSFLDPKWFALNPPGFRYGDGGNALNARVQGAQVGKLSHPAPGFINYYSMASVAEDQAELFEALFESTSRGIVEQFAARDKHLVGKLHYLNRLITYYNVDRSSPRDVNYRQLREAMFRRRYTEIVRLLTLPEPENPGEVVGIHGEHVSHLIVAYNLNIDLLRQEGVDLNSLNFHAIDDDGWNVLHYAAVTGSTQHIERLLMEDANPDWKDRAGMTPGRLAVTLKTIDEWEWDKLVRRARLFGRGAGTPRSDKAIAKRARRDEIEAAWLAKLERERQEQANPPARSR